MTNPEAEAKRVFRECGAALVTLGRGLKLGGQLVALGRELRAAASADLTEHKLATLRQPIDHFRALVDDLTTMMGELRTLTDVLSAAIGYDN